MHTHLLPYRANRLILALYLVLATIYSVMTPAWEAPDEVGHFAYIRHIRETGSLPDVREVAAGEAHQPPLYYLIGAIVSLPVDLSTALGKFHVNPNFMWNRNGGTDVNVNLRGSADTFPFLGQTRGLHLARLSSVLMGVATIALIMRIGHDIFPTRSEVGFLAGAITAFNPQFLFLSGALNNDNLLILTVTGTIWQTLRAMKRPFSRRQWVYVGIWLSGVMLTKLTGAAIVLAVGAVLIALSIRRRSFRILLHGGLSVGLSMIILSGWWYIRNQLLYGDPLGYSVYEEIFAVNMRRTPLQWHDLREFVGVQFRSFWGVFGWMNVPAPDWYFTAVRLIVWAAFIGLIVALLRQQLRRLDKEQKQSLLFLATALLLQEGFIVWMLTRCNASCYQGRYLLPVVAPITVFVALGLLAWIPTQQQHLLVKTAVPMITAVALFMPLQVISPVYEITPLPLWQTWLIPHKTDATFSQMFRLHGHERSQLDDQIQVDLYWQAMQKPDFDYSAFVHLVDAGGQLITQDDQGIGQSMSYLPTQWMAGDLVIDEHRLAIPNSLPPGEYQLRVGIYNWSNGNRLPAIAQGQPAGDFVVIDEISLP